MVVAIHRSAPASMPLPQADSSAAITDVAERIVIVGSGPAGVRVAERLAELAPERHVLLLGDEPFRPYDRVRLSSVVARELMPDRLYASPDLGHAANLEILADRRIVAIDRQLRRVVDAYGGGFPFAKLVLATGSRARLPSIPGLELDKVYAFRSMRDAERLLARQVGSRSVVVVGGGLLGLEAARAMCRFGTRVHVVEHESRLMFHQLDDEAAGLLREHIERIGIEVHLKQSVQQIVGRYRPEFVRLRSGVEIECDTVVLATGITPNVELAREAGLAVGRGIRVNDFMQTADVDIYAVGECAEHRDQIYGLVGPGLEQAGVAASHIAGLASAYRGSIAASSLKVVGRPVFSMGEVIDTARSFSTHVYRDQDRYRRLNVCRGRIIGAIGFGEWDTARLRAALHAHRVWPWHLGRFRRTGELWTGAGRHGVAEWPATAIVCACRGVTRQDLDAAIRRGASSLDALAGDTGAATVCGSCKPLLLGLLGSGARAPLPRALVFASLLGLVLAVAALGLSLPYAASMKPGWRYDALWTNGSIKQATGFSLLALAALLSLLSLRKRLRWLTALKFPTWQLAHVVGGVLAGVTLALHTGFRIGSNLNAWLMLSFIGLLVAGGLAGAAVGIAQRYDAGLLRRLKHASLWMHILLLWPLPALLGFHILKSYYF